MRYERTASQARKLKTKYEFNYKQRDKNEMKKKCETRIRNGME